MCLNQEHRIQNTYKIQGYDTVTKRGSYKADRAEEAPGQVLDEEIATLPKKKRIMFMLVAARQRDTWLTIRDLEHVATRGYIYRLMEGFKLRGFVTSRLIPIRMVIGGFKRLTKLSGWRGTDSLLSFVSLQSLQKEGPLPRYTQIKRKKRSKTEHEPKKILVTTRPANELIGIDYAYTEELKVWVQMDPAVAAALRTKMVPPRVDDRAEQYMIQTEAFTLTLSLKDKARFDLHTLNWADALAQLCVLAGTSKSAIKSLISMVNHSIPEGFAKVEFPLFLQQLNEVNAEYKMDTEIFDETGKSIGWWVKSNINRSLTVDYEVLGKVYAVDSFLSTMSAMQHQSAVNYASIKHKALQEAEQREKDRKEAEMAMVHCSCEKTIPVMVAERYLCQICGKPLTNEQLERVQTEKREQKEKDSQDNDDSWRSSYG